MGTYTDFYSHVLGRSMGVMAYGHGGVPCLVFPSQDGNCRDFEGFGMLEPCEPWLGEGRLRLYCVDSLDMETWSAAHLDPAARMRRHEEWFRHITEEIVPFIRRDSGWEGRIMTHGCSMGATHAVNALFRRPDVFGSVIALSGAYDPEWFLGGYSDALVYLNSPISSVRGMPPGHPYIDMLNTCRIVVCCGSGAWEEEMLRSSRLLEEACREKGIRAWFDVWGGDVNHDWPWWRTQLHYFLGKVL
ncbi:MAG TPA: alpha/beta hydrolase-fold protein [Candidatus Limnocylindria bacterium]|nr:alpha/beta hydrolase-fold protein [Candidatus Limnocylindria bacterium]